MDNSYHIGIQIWILIQYNLENNSTEKMQFEKHTNTKKI